jgi:hypothetical protein
VFLNNNVFRSSDQRYQYLNTKQREKLLRDYQRALENYRQAVTRARARYAEMIRLGLVRAEEKNSES